MAYLAFLYFFNLAFVLRSGKGLVTSVDLKTKARLKKYKNARYAIRNVSMKDLSYKIKEFETLSRYLM